MTRSARRVAARVVLVLTAGGILVLGPSAAMAQAPSPTVTSTSHHTGSMCAGMDGF